MSPNFKYLIVKGTFTFDNVPLKNVKRDCAAVTSKLYESILEPTEEEDGSSPAIIRIDLNILHLRPVIPKSLAHEFTGTFGGKYKEFSKKYLRHYLIHT